MASEALCVVHIFSTSFAGSTWLNLLLGAHGRAMSVGEIKSILKVHGAVCTVHGQACPVWPRIAVDDPARNIYHQLHEVTGLTHFIANNSRKFLDAQRVAGIDQKFVHLLRDGRAIVASHMRKYQDRSAWQASRLWRREVRRNARLMRRQDRARVFEVKYEALKQDTRGQLERLCEYIGLEYEEGMLRFWEKDQHFLGGNRGTLFSMLRAADRDLPDDPDRRQDVARPNWDLSYYSGQDPARFQDERWRQELDARSLRAFAWVGGRLNRKLGYGR